MSPLHSPILKSKSHIVYSRHNINLVASRAGQVKEPCFSCKIYFTKTWLCSCLSCVKYPHVPHCNDNHESKVNTKISVVLSKWQLFIHRNQWITPLQPFIGLSGSSPTTLSSRIVPYVHPSTGVLKQLSFPKQDGLVTLTVVFWGTTIFNCVVHIKNDIIHRCNLCDSLFTYVF